MIFKEEILNPGQSNDLRFRKVRSDGPIREFDASAIADLTLSTSAAELHKSKPTKPLWISPDPTEERSPAPSNETVSRLEADLAQKDELVNALVRELEQAAEQLDRLRRTGNDRPHEAQPVPAFSPAPEPVEMQLPDLDDLQQMAEQWHQIQPGSVLSRIESQLASFHDLISNLRFAERAPAEHREPEQRGRQIPNEPDRTIDIERANVTLEESSSSWEAIKRQILGEEAPPPQEEQQQQHQEQQHYRPPQQSHYQQSAPITDSSIDDDIEVLKTVSSAPSPQNVDFGSADVQALRKAIDERDEYIIQLNRIFRAKSAFSVPADWATLANVPKEMQLRVEALIERLDVQVRLGEVEMSLERARVARERSQIESEREQLDKHLRRLGVTSIAELGNISAATGTSSDRRWMRFLGPSAK